MILALYFGGCCCYFGRRGEGLVEAGKEKEVMRQNL